MNVNGIPIHSLTQAKLMDQFKAGLEAWDWETWSASGSSEREEIVVNAIAELGLQIGIEEAYDLFYEWADTLTPEDFRPSEEFETEEGEF